MGRWAVLSIIDKGLVDISPSFSIIPASLYLERGISRTVLRVAVSEVAATLGLQAAGPRRRRIGSSYRPISTQMTAAGGVATATPAMASAFLTTATKVSPDRHGT